MVYIKYIQGYGPYAYLSKRKGPEVKTVYLGPVSVDIANLFTKKQLSEEKHKNDEKIIRNFERFKESVENAGKNLRVETLLPETIKKTNEKVIDKFGGEKGVINPYVLDFISANVKTTKGLYKKSAVLLISISQRQPFLDGNKRTAFECTTDFLKFHGKEFKIEKPEKIQYLVNEVASGDKSFPEVVKWLKKRTKS